MAVTGAYAQDLFYAGVTQYYPLYTPGAQTWFVAPATYTAPGGGKAPSDQANGGMDAREPLLTPGQGYTNAVSGRGDTICLMPGTYVQTARLALTAKPGLRLVASKPFSAVLTGDGVITTLLSVDANDVEIAGIRFVGVAALTLLLDLANTSAIRNCHIHHCQFIGLETVAGVSGILNGENVAGNDAAQTIIEHCYFEGLSANSIWTFGGGARIVDNFINLDDTAGCTGMRIGDQGAAFATRKACFWDGNVFVGQTDQSGLLAVTFAGAEANTQMWASGPRGNAFASCAAPTANIHPEGAAGASYVGTTTTTAPTLWPA